MSRVLLGMYKTVARRRATFINILFRINTHIKVKFVRKTINPGAKSWEAMSTVDVEVDLRRQKEDRTRARRTCLPLNPGTKSPRLLRGIPT